MANNLKQNGRKLPFVATQDYTSGELALIGDTIGIAQGPYLTGEDGVLDLEGVYEVPKEPADDVALGVKLYRRDADGLVSTDSTGARACGVAFKPAAAASKTVWLRLNASF